MGKLLTLIAVFAIGLFFIKGHAPGFWHNATQLYQKHAGWTEEARRENPVGYLTYARSTLRANVGKMKLIIRELERRIGALEQEQNTLAADQKQYDRLLRNAKALYQRAESGKQNYPVRFVGASYKKDELVAQTRIIFERNEQIKVRLLQLAAAKTSAAHWLGSMYQKRAVAEDTVRDLYTAITIAQAHQSAALVEETIASVAEIAQDIDLYVVRYERGRIPVRDASKLVSDSARMSDSAFIAFLED